jgi:hypothetical protein
MTETRPQWALDAYLAWHKKICDHNDPSSCGWEGVMWYPFGEGWGRTAYDGKTVVFFPNGNIVEIDKPEFRTDNKQFGRLTIADGLPEIYGSVGQ